MPVHTKFAADHATNRFKICAPCGRKINGLRKINDIQSCIIIENLCPDFSLFDERFPVCICDACRRDLSNIAKKKKASLKAFPEYTKLVVPKSTRAEKVCPCYICITGREKGTSGKI